MRAAVMFRGPSAVYLPLLVCWCAVAYAKSPGFGADMATIPVDSVAYVLALALIGGLAPAIRRVRRSAHSSNAAVASGVLQDLVTSLVAGLLVFFVTDGFAVNSTATAAAVTIAGWGGAQVMDRVLDGWLDRYFPPRDYDGEERRHRTEHPEVERRRAPEPDPEE